MQKFYKLIGLDCPNCSAKIEKKIGEIKGVSLSRINLVTQKLTVETNSDSIDIECIESIVHSFEPDVKVEELTESSEASAENNSENKKAVVRLIIGAVFFLIAVVIDKTLHISFPVSLLLYLMAYVIFGYDVVVKAFTNIIHGRFFDENFLMTISTIGAFTIREYPEAVAVMLFYQIGEFLQSLSVNRSRKSISALVDLKPDSASLVVDGEIISVSPDNVRVGDVIIVKSGEKVPLDGIVIQGNSAVDMSMLTGESLPVNISSGDEVYSGSINQGGVIKIKVTKECNESTAQKIIELVETASANKAPAENFITTFSKYYTPVVVLLAVLLTAVPLLFAGGEFKEWLHRSLVFLVVSCPCALVISVPLTFFGGIGAASRRGILVKGSNCLQAMTKVDTVVFDKTGTLTKGEFNVTKINCENGFSADEVLRLAAYVEQYSDHPIAKSILNLYKGDFGNELSEDYTEIPGMGVSATVEGRRILAGNKEFMEKSGIICPCDNSLGTKVYVGVDGVLAGNIIISDEIRSDSKSAIEALGKSGIKRTVMLTGDSKQTGETVSAELGIDECYTQLLPQDKVNKFELIKKNAISEGLIAFVGDGVNDAPVLARADLGIAMGGLGSDAAIQAADVVLMTDEPSKLVEAFALARKTRLIVIQNVVFALSVKIIILLFGALGLSGMWEAVFGDVGVTLIAVANAMRIIRK